MEYPYFGTSRPAYNRLDAIHKTVTRSVVLSQPQDQGSFLNVSQVAVSLTSFNGTLFQIGNRPAPSLWRKP